MFGARTKNIIFASATMSTRTDRMGNKKLNEHHSTILAELLARVSVLLVRDSMNIYR
jgi:hypothetical protein